jgi:hypothetical protein
MPELLEHEYDLKIISFRRNSVSPETRKELDKLLVYQDTDYNLMEDVYSVEDSIEEYSNPEIIEIKRICDQNNTVFFRLVNI